jgi:hypothetical protein
MRDSVAKLVALGPLPAADAAEDSQLKEYEELLERISPPVTDQEARALARLFGPDDCYGLAWTLLHLVETAPGWPLRDVLESPDNEWLDRLRLRAQRANLP